MLDMRDYKEAIQMAVTTTNNADPNWEWTVKAIHEQEVHIGWSYLDYMGEGYKYFIMTMDIVPEIHKDGECWITGYMTDLKLRRSLFFTVGKGPWAHTDNVRTAIFDCIEAIACTAHNIY